MRLLKLRIAGFGKLSDCMVDFTPGFNLVYGPNESGKSTLQRAILALLYGFWGEGSITRSRSVDFDALRPWDTKTPYAGSLSYRLDTGAVFEIQRTFAPKQSTKLLRLPDGTDVSSDYPHESRGRLYFGQAQWGMSKEVFESTCFVRQAELAIAQNSASAITDTLMRFAASASADTTTSAAVALLDQALRDQVGTERAWTKPLARARQRVRELEDERRQAEQRQREARALLEQRKQIEEHRDRLGHETLRLRALRLLAEQQLVQDRLLRAQAADSEVRRWAAIVTDLELWADFPVALRDTVLDLRAQRSRLKRDVVSREPKARRDQDERDRLAAKIADLEQQIALLADAQDTVVSAARRIDELEALHQATTSQERVAVERYEQARQAYETLEADAAAGKEDLAPLIALGYEGLAAMEEQLKTAAGALEQASDDLDAAKRVWDAWDTDEDLLALLPQDSEDALRRVPPKGALTYVPEWAEVRTQAERSSALAQKARRLRYLCRLTERSALRSWLAAIEQAEEEAEHWLIERNRLQAWSGFGVRHEAIQALQAQREDAMHEYREVDRRIEETASVRQSVITRLREIDAQLQSFGGHRLDTSRLPTVLSLEAQWRTLCESQCDAEQRYRQAESTAHELGRRLQDLEKQLGPRSVLGLPELERMRESVLSVSEQLRDANAQADVSKEEWSRVGLSEDRFAMVTRTAQTIESGALAPSYRKGCAGFLHRGQPPQEPMPVEITVYRQALPIHERMLNARRELEAVAESWAQTQVDISERSQITADELLDAKTYGLLRESMERRDSLKRDVDHQQAVLADARIGADKARERRQRVQEQLRAELAQLGLRETDMDLGAAVRRYATYCEQAGEARTLNAERSGLLAQAQAAQGDLDLLEQKRRGLSEIEDELADALAERLGSLPQEASGVGEMGVRAADSIELSARQAQKDIDAQLAIYQQHIDSWQLHVGADTRYHRALEALAATFSEGLLVESGPSGARLAKKGIKAQLSVAEADIARAIETQPEWAQLEADQTTRAYQEEMSRVEEDQLATVQALSTSKQILQNKLEVLRRDHGEMQRQRARRDQARQRLDALRTDACDRLGDLARGSELDFTSLRNRLSAALGRQAELRRQRQSLDDRRSEVDTVRGERLRVEADLRAELARVGISDGDLLASVAAYREQCDKKQQLDTLEHDRDRVIAEHRGLSDAISVWESSYRNMADIEQRLGRLLAEAGADVAALPLDEALEEFEAHTAKQREWSEANVQYEYAVHLRDSTLGEQTIDSLEQAVKGLSAQLQAARMSRPELLQLRATQSSDEYASLQHQMQQELLDRETELDGLRQKITAQAQQGAHLAELDEEIARARESLRSLEALRDTLTRAHEELIAATQEYQKQFAPKLASVLSEGLSVTTAGRYRQVKVDPQTLDVRLVEPDYGRLVDSSNLSAGTRDIVYLFLRVAIAMLMSGQETPPLILDDPLTQCDRDRQLRLLEYLARLAGTLQILYFTKDESIKDWFEGQLASEPVHRCHITGL